MAIQPIDLQALFTQLDKVGKEQAVLKDGLAIQQALENAVHQKKVDHQFKSVNETQTTGTGPEKVKDRSPHQGREEHKGSRKEPHAESGEEREEIQDPNLGNNVDLSG